MDADDYNWIRGRAAVAAYVARRFARQYRIEPVAFDQDGNVVYIAGYFARGDGAALRRFGLVTLSLGKQRDGQWKISSESVNFGPPAPAPAEAEGPS